MKQLILFFLIFWGKTIFSQYAAFQYQNAVYDDFVKSITFEVNNLPTNFPILRLNSNEFITLKFDDLLNEERTLYYKFIHCDKDWTPSRMTEMETIAGFNDERLRNYSYSINTRKPYIHYFQRFPNASTNFKLSGNYLLVVYEDNVDSPLFTRRLLVSENKVAITISNTYPGDVENIRYKQELKVDVNYERFKMRNPLEELTLVVLQNENWNTSISAKPSFFTGPILKFNKVKTFGYWGLTEYRELDLRSLIRLGRGVRYIERNNDEYDIFLTPDRSRREKVYILYYDFNGKFYVDNFDKATYTNASQALDQFVEDIKTDTNISQAKKDSIIFSSLSNVNLSANEAEERDIRSDYGYVTFTIEDQPQIENGDIYIFGAMNNWQPNEEYKMVYNEKRQVYSATVLLKQGYYNYMYGIVDDEGQIDYVGMEGSWSDTENEYQSIAYYRGLGDIYDKIIGFESYNINTQTLKNK